jgi:phenylacetate-CoA ligase
VNLQDLHGVYRRMPVPAQEAMATAYGLREFYIRHARPYSTYCRELDARQWWSPERLEEDQQRRLDRLVLWCARRVPYYRELFADLGIDPRDVRSRADLAALPLLDKATVRADPDRFLPDAPRPALVAQTTGGTTGAPLRYWTTYDAVRFNYATYEARTRRWAGVRFGDRMASLHGQVVVPADQVEGPFWRRNPAFNQLYFSVYHLSDANLPAYVDRMARFDPAVVAGYTSAVHRMAVHLLETGPVGRIRPRAVIVSSETLLDDHRAQIESAFGCRVHNAYSLGELVVYASECDAGHLHLSPEYGATEIVEVDGVKEIVATGLFNLGMPLLRYRTGDTATERLVGVCECGRGLPRLLGLSGRTDDAIRTPEGTVVGPTALALALKPVPNLRRAQEHQERVEDLRVLVEVAAAWSADDEALLVAEIRKRVGATVGIDVERVDTMPRTRGGKERLIVSSLGRRAPDADRPHGARPDGARPDGTRPDGTRPDGDRAAP